ncbi:ABC transporter related protein [Nostocoides jenkinsii Ben 74]|uniref:ABC transporter related protein n=2 Tax=Nostocoides jenkinsii TaxID=330834 RepID=A0A077M8G2_9MICO|nr:ABC transporter related protein [Tetrasphaera jenkinsii Ben 74]
MTLHSVTFQRGRRVILDDLTWSLPATGRTLLLGRNGAGKTTTLRLLSGAIAPKRGTVKIDGHDAGPKELRRRVAMMPQHISSMPRLNVVEQVAFAAWLSGRSESSARSAAVKAIAQVDLSEKGQMDPARLSGGELRRVGLAEALARPSELLLLDEPTAGLDPTQRARFRDVVLSLDRPTVISTHQLDDVDQLVASVVVLDGGRIVFDGPVDDFLRRGQGPDVARMAESAFTSLTSTL